MRTTSHRNILRFKPTQTNKTNPTRWVSSPPSEHNHLSFESFRRKLILIKANGSEEFNLTSAMQQFLSLRRQRSAKPSVRASISVLHCHCKILFVLQALGSFYFLHESLKNIYQFDFKAKKYKKVTGKEIYSDTLESTPMLEKEKFPQDYFPECKWSRKGFIRTRWCITDCAFDLVNIHLFHDASNLIAWETSPSVYSGIRHKALGYVLDRIIDQRFEKVSYFVFGDFNFRLDAKAVVETLCAKATMQTVRAADTNEVVKLIFRESDNDRKVMLQLEKKLFDYFNQDVFRDNNGTALLEFDRELSVFKDRLYELDISFPPSYPYSEDSSQGKQYMNTRCPAWCDRILMSHSAKELILKSENDEKIVIYDHIGPNVCMGDHKEKDANGTRRFSVKPACSRREGAHHEQKHLILTAVLINQVPSATFLDC
ncbi:inositol polyphosphate-5-phosphatase A isoform X1 [Pezoporus occidentalis]|uniref:inositol polyphosphate-5-phosphatase A isoform X1 n=1 Tax=Pezoporus occidentalis TaxID=407982 RepID=UPI002F915978